MQKAAVTQETCAVNGVEVVDTALGTTDQLEALTCAGTVRPCGSAAWAPPASINSGSDNNATAQTPVKTRIEDRIAVPPHRFSPCARLGAPPSS
jgi:hypothetical protein